MKRKTTIATTFALAFVAVLGLADLASSGTIDAVSSASGKLKVSGSTTTSSATVNFSFPYSGTNRLYYDVVDHTSVSAFPKYVQTSTKSFSVANLTGGTKYFYWVQIVDPTGREPSANAHSTLTVFTTDGSSAVLPRQGAWQEGSAQSAVDPLGRRNPTRSVRIGPDGGWIDLNSGHR